MKIENVSFRGIHINHGEVTVSSYEDGGASAIRVMDNESGPFMIATVNLIDYGMIPAPGNVFLKDLDTTRWMQELGVVGAAERTVPYGPFDARAFECPLLDPDQ